MDYKFFNNIGSKLKVLSVVLFYIEWIGGMIGGLILAICGWDAMVVIGIALVPCAILLAWMLSAPLYAFGDLVESASYLVHHSDK